MKLFLVRHGETVDNVAGNYAGITDSALTSHGILQARRLGASLASIPITHFFSSDLQRAFLTSEAVREAQAEPTAKTTKLTCLREQDFGVWEGKRSSERKEGQATGPGDGGVESKDSMRARAKCFLDEHLLPLMKEENAVLAVSHGIFLSHLWRSLLSRFDVKDVAVVNGVVERGLGLEYLGGWSNTGYLELEIKPRFAKDFQSKDRAFTSRVHPSLAPQLVPTVFPHKLPMILHVQAVNSLTHLEGLKKTRGGIGSAKHDIQQSTIEFFFKKRKLN